MADSVTLTGATRTNLLSLQRTTDLIGKTQERLSTGKKVNSAIDDALAFFTARNLDNRASDLMTLKNGINEAINQVQTAVKSLESVEDILKQMKAVAASAKSTDATDTASRVKLAQQFNDLRTQIDYMTEDSSFNGINLIKSGADTLTVKFSEVSDSRALTITGVRSDASGLSLAEASASSAANSAASNASTTWINSTTFNTNIDSAISTIDSALTTVRSTAQTFGGNASLLQIRREFTENLTTTLQNGAAELVNADMNEESANMLALQTRQQLGTISLSIAQQSEQAVLRLF
jgi:flagellin-like hook-associated protein FlgL